MGMVGEDGQGTPQLPHNLSPHSLSTLRKRHPCLPSQLIRKKHSLMPKKLQQHLATILQAGEPETHHCCGGAKLLLLGSWGDWGL